MKKFGIILNGPLTFLCADLLSARAFFRMFGMAWYERRYEKGEGEAKEAVARVRQVVNGSEEDITLDFSGVEVLTPSFADELVRGISAIYPEKKIRYSGLEENESLRDTFVAIGIKTDW